MRKKTAILMFVITVLVTPGFSATISLTEDGLGLSHGNYGQYLVVDDIIRISTLTHIGQASASAGTVYLEGGSKGFGTQNFEAEGSKAISGGGGDQDEAVVLEFLAQRSAASIVVGLADYKEGDDDPVINLVLSNGSEYVFTESHANWAGAVTALGKEKVLVDFSVLLGGGFSGTANSLSITETKGHLYVNSISYDNHVPEPATIALLGAGALMVLPMSRK